MPAIERLVVGPLATNCYVLKSADEIAVVDPGGDEEQVLLKIRELGGRVRYVINTHGHLDHMAANQGVVRETGAELVIHRLDATMLTSPDRNLAGLIGVSVDSPAAGRVVEEDDVLVVGEEELRVYHTPGHTPGSICLIATEYAFTGDTLFLESIGRTDFPGGSDSQMRRSLSRLQVLLKPEMLIYPGHDAPGSFSRALLVNPFLGSTILA